MNAHEWIKQAEDRDWRLETVKGLELVVRCSKQGCDGQMVLPLANLGPIPARCSLPHVGRYSAKVFKTYENLIDQFRRRRCSLGLSQEDITAASGLADGHINKLEAFDRSASMPTLQLWAETLGLEIAVNPIPLPRSTLRVIEQRATNPYREEMARFKPQQKALFHE